MTNDVVFYLRGIPRLSRDRFKAACAKRGKNMREVAIALFELYADTESVEILTPGEEQQWLKRVMDKVNKNRLRKSTSKSPTSTSK